METESTPRTNRSALASLIAAMLTLLFLCIGVAPIPFTSLVCYPSGLLTSTIALAAGFIALGQIRRNGEKGRGLALAGIWLGGLTVLFIFCFSTVAVLFLPRLFDYLLREWQRYRPVFQSATEWLVPWASNHAPRSTLRSQSFSLYFSL